MRKAQAGIESLPIVTLSEGSHFNQKEVVLWNDAVIL